jgi:tRNA pseudouridine38-40 synthase
MAERDLVIVTRWKITVEYHGGGYVGWQMQDNGPSIQQALEEAITKFSGETPRVNGCGRTDAGVHALGQVAHFDLERPTPPMVVCDAMNAYLRPQPISVLAAEMVDDRFDARLRAKKRFYRYRILNRRAPEALDQGLAWHVPKPLDAEAMHLAAQCLVGRHDFSSFRAAQCQAKSPVKTISEISVLRDGENIHVDVTAPSFLHHQVRNIVGTLKLVGQGSWNAGEVQRALEACDRSAAGPTAPACGLYFVKVEY